MTDLYHETAYFERLTVEEVSAACEKVIPHLNYEVTPSMFDAGVVVRHGPGQGPTIEQADRIAEILREGRDLKADKADWHATGLTPYSDAIDPSVVYGTIFGLVRAFLPSAATLERLRA